MSLFSNSDLARAFPEYSSLLANNNGALFGATRTTVSLEVIWCIFVYLLHVYYVSDPSYRVVIALHCIFSICQ